MDLVEEKREDAYAKIAAYKQRVTGYHKRKVRPRAFNVGDLVLRKAKIRTSNDGVGKLMPNWEGPYEVTKVLGASAYTTRKSANNNRKIATEFISLLI